MRAKDLSVNVAIAVWEWYHIWIKQKKKVSLIKSSHAQYENPIHSGNKIIGTYFSNTMALPGSDSGAMRFDDDKNGFISEGSGENIFLNKR